MFGPDGVQTYGSRRRSRTSSILSQIEGRILVRSTRTSSLRKNLSHDYRQRTDPKPQWTYKDSELRASSEREKQVRAQREEEMGGRVFFAEENERLSAKKKVVDLDAATQRRLAMSTSLQQILGPRDRESRGTSKEPVKRKRPPSAGRRILSPRGPEPKPTWSHILRTALNKRDPGVEAAHVGSSRSKSKSPAQSPRAGSKTPRGDRGGHKGKGGGSPGRSPKHSPSGGDHTPRSPRGPLSPRSPRHLYAFDNYDLPLFMRKRVEMVPAESVEDLVLEYAEVAPSGTDTAHGGGGGGHHVEQT
ncbi:unnamed protein product [Amoebophrya sp. A25]|nr:unnamed protein product [Amoebophrya sp. A25]|eukprot:GSA25T00012253001.1